MAADCSITKKDAKRYDYRSQTDFPERNSSK